MQLKEIFTQLDQRVNGPHATQQARELVFLDVIKPLINCIGEELIHT